MSSRSIKISRQKSPCSEKNSGISSTFMKISANSNWDVNAYTSEIIAEISCVLQLLERYWPSHSAAVKKSNQSYTKLHSMRVFLLVSHNVFSVLLIVDINMIFLRVVLTSLNTLFNITCWHSLAGQPPKNTSFSENDRENVNSIGRQGF